MQDITKEEQFKGVQGWWNSDKIVKWDNEYDDYDAHTIRYLRSRQSKVLHILSKLGLPKAAKVLELGYGAGQTALKIGQMGFDMSGVDISEKLCELSKKRCKKECPEGKFDLRVGNIEQDIPFEEETFDVVIIVGALQYLYDDTACLKEVFRVLKKGGKFIVAQRNAYCISAVSSLREILRALVYLFLREKYELFASYKSILVDSKLGKVFGKYENSKFFNSKFMTKGHDNWKYKMKKKLYSLLSLKSLVKKCGFSFIKSSGAYYPFSEKKLFFDFNLKYDDFFEKYLSRILYPFARTVIVLAEKPEK